MSPPSLCGTFLTNKRSLVAFTWTLTTVLTFTAFVMAIVMTGHIHAQYIRIDRYYNALMEYNEAGDYNCNNENNNNKNGEGQNGENNNNNYNKNYNNCQDHGSSADEREIEIGLRLGHVGSKSVAAVALFTVLMALGLSLYGSTTIVGFTSMRGDYIAPCFSPTANQNLKIGMFGGAIVLFANVLFVCAMILGEVRVEDWSEHNDRDDNNNNNKDQRMAPYEIERISTVLAVTCMFLAPLYIIFAVLLFFFYGDAVSEDDTNETADFYALDQGTQSRHHSHHLHPHHHHHSYPTPQPPSSQAGAASSTINSQHPPPPIINHLVGPGTSVPRIGSDQRNSQFF
ncbi:hypothetical protein ACA910_021239 [Epithemia clementina (nom. ined.)]